MAICLFTADLRVHDNPVLCGALNAADQVVPLFVLDDGIRAVGFVSPNRGAFLADCLADLDRALRARGGRLVVRRGEVVTAVRRVAEETGADEVHLARDVSGYARRREEGLRVALSGAGRRLRVHDAAVSAVAPGAVTPAGKGHFAVFTPYLRQWSRTGPSAPPDAPTMVRVPRVRSEPLPVGSRRSGTSPGLPRGGEDEARRRAAAWLDGPVGDYADQHDDLAVDGTSRLSPYLHFGCLSAAALVRQARERGGAGAAAFVRQLAWRDFNRQLLADAPHAAWADYRPRRDRWRADEADVVAWCAGRTGYPIVDAAMRQLIAEGWMHNRGRLITASFLTKTLYVDWRVGARHFLSLLVDGDIANNALNWQWVAGTGAATRPNQVLNPLTQARRFDPRGDYVRRWVPELATIGGGAVHRPWELPPEVRARLDYPDPIVDLSEGLARFRRARAGR